MALGNAVDTVKESRVRLDIPTRKRRGPLDLDFELILEHPWWVITGFADRLAMGERLQPIAVDAAGVREHVREFEKFQPLTVLYGYPCNTVNESIAVAAIVEGMQLIQMGAKAVVHRAPSSPKKATPPRFMYAAERRPLAEFMSGPE